MKRMLTSTLILTFILIIPAQFHVVVEMDDFKPFCDGFLLTAKAPPERIHVQKNGLVHAENTRP